MRQETAGDIVDVFVIGGGINGCGIARDAAGRGLKVALAEMNDLASATSSASTKLFHGGLRYLEYFEFRLVRESADRARDAAARDAAHQLADALRAALSAGYAVRERDADVEAARRGHAVDEGAAARVADPARAFPLRQSRRAEDAAGDRDARSSRARPRARRSKPRFAKAFEYSDCWVEDSRLVVLNARDAAGAGRAHHDPHEGRVGASGRAGSGGSKRKIPKAGGCRCTGARVLVNAGGPWAGEMHPQRAAHQLARACAARPRQPHRDAQALRSRRVLFLPGHRRADHLRDPLRDRLHPDRHHGRRASGPVGQARLHGRGAGLPDRLRQPLPAAEDRRRADIVWTYSGVRPLYDDGASSATAATRDYVLKLDEAGRRAAPQRLRRQDHDLPAAGRRGGREDRRGSSRRCRATWTTGVPLPGGDFPVDGVDALVARLQAAHPFLTEPLGAPARPGLRDARPPTCWAAAQEARDLGRDFGGTLTAREVEWLMRKEYARTAEDVLWRRSKLGLRLTPDEARALDDLDGRAPQGRGARGGGMRGGGRRWLWN